MADVTISQLTKGTPSGNNTIPFSNGSSTLGASVSAILEGTNKVGIGVNPNLFNNSLVIKGVDSPTFTGNQPLGLGLLNGGNYDLTGIDFKNLTGNSLAGRIGVEVTGAGGYMKFGTSNNYSIGITNTALTIDPNGRITTPLQPHISGQLQNNSGNGYANNANVQQSNGGMVFQTSGTTGVLVPTSGVYLITINMISGYGSGRNDTKIYVNSEEIITLLNDQGTGYRQRSGSITWRCSSGDIIRFWSDNWYDVSDLQSHWKTFSVTLLG